MRIYTGWPESWMDPQIDEFCQCINPLYTQEGWQTAPLRRLLGAELAYSQEPVSAASDEQNPG